MVNAACARDFPAYSFGDLVTAVSTVQGCTMCETIFESHRQELSKTIGRALQIRLDE